MLADSTSQYCFVPAKPAESTSDYYFVLHRLLPNTSRTTSCYRTRAKYFLVQVCTTKLAENTSQYDFVLQSAQKVPSGITWYLQSFHKVLPTTTSYYTACAKYFQYYFAPQRGGREGERGAREDLLQSLQKVVPGTTLYYKDCRKYLPVLLRTIKLAESISQLRLCTTKLVEHTSQNILPSTTSYYKARRKYLPVFVLQSFHKMRPATTSYYKACAQYFPVLPRTTRLVQGGARGGKRGPELLCITKLPGNICQEHFVLQSLRKTIPSTASYYQACRKYFRDLPSTTVYYKACKSYSHTTLYYEACKKYFPVIPCTTKLPRNHHTKHNFSFVLRPNLLRNFLQFLTIETIEPLLAGKGRKRMQKTTFS